MQEFLQYLKGCIVAEHIGVCGISLVTCDNVTTDAIVQKIHCRSTLCGKAFVSAPDVSVCADSICQISLKHLFQSAMLLLGVIK